MLAWPLLSRRIAAARRLEIVLDYDGTLVPIASHPSRATLSSRTRTLLATIARRPDCSLVLVSGRTVRDLKRMVRVRGLGYAGNHGLEIDGEPSLARRLARHRPVLRRLARELSSALRAVPGAWVEDKRATLSIHWRAVRAASVRRFHALLTHHLAPLSKQGRVRVTYGKRVVEVRPPIAWDKGSLVRWWRRHMGKRSHGDALVVYCGDDRTDEAAFAAVNRRGGLSVFVGRPPHGTQARWRLENPQAVQGLLATIVGTRCQSSRTR